ncbi:hypothetical protein NOK12_16870 [Nocardioides sp. OK12]|nr:hypothetical protein [Nocardioides sp. OK12]GHJ59169.1 hypothetical protein NOK12_16870 [Nocardioides sp. OK12]
MIDRLLTTVQAVIAAVWVFLYLSTGDPTWAALATFAALTTLTMAASA